MVRNLTSFNLMFPLVHVATQVFQFSVAAEADEEGEMLEHVAWARNTITAYSPWIIHIKKLTLISRG